jgi:DNA (cytosine-5)-methyltransferase 1
MRYVSLFSGIEAVTVATEPLGWEPVAFAEIEPFPCAVLAHHWPDVPNLGDVTKIDWTKFKEEHGTVDVVVGGSPCQSFSIAGGRESLDGESRLMFEYIRAVQELRPSWFLWENVPGCLSTRDNAFGQLLGEMADLGYGLAWRTLDAQFFGVAQRRRRVFLVGRLGDDPSGPVEVLFEREGVRGDHPSSREKREALTARTGRGAQGTCGNLTPWDVQSKRINAPDGVSPTLSSGTTEGMNIQPVVAFKTDHLTKNGRIVGALHTGSGKNEHFVMTQYGNQVAGTLTARYDRSPCPDRGQNVICMADGNEKAAIDENLCGTLKVGGGVRR